MEGKLSKDSMEKNVSRTDSLTKQDSDSFVKNKSSTLKNLNNAKGKNSVLAEDSSLKRKSSLSISLSTVSELISVAEPLSKINLSTKSLQPKSQITSENVSSQNNTIATHKKQSHSSLFNSNINNITSNISYETERKISLQKFDSLYEKADKLTRQTTLLETSNKGISQGTTDPSLNYESQNALTKSSSKLKLSQPSTKGHETKDLKTKYIPPRTKSEMSSSDSRERIFQNNLQEKIKSLMEKHSRLMLVKRGESRKQLILKSSDSGLGTVKMTSKNTRYYMAPLPRQAAEFLPGNNKNSTISEENISVNPAKNSDGMAMTTKTSRSQAKTEVSNVLKSLYNSNKLNREVDEDKHKSKHQQIKCPEITPSQIRDYVNSKTLDSNERELHEIIKIKKVPSFGTQSSRKPTDNYKYIINIPKYSEDGQATVNKITVKEKHKLRIHSVEDINENTTEIVYNKDHPKTQDKVKTHFTTEKKSEHDVMPYSKVHKSPTKSKTLKVTAESTPVISNLLRTEEQDRDKILLIQYEKKSKPCKDKPEAGTSTLVSTQLLGIKQPCNDRLKEMYLYGTETDGKTCKEKIRQVDDISPTLREKVNMIFQELREMTFKPCAELESTEKSQPSVSSKTFQYPSILVETDAVSVQALPEVKSAEVQVNDSLIFSQPPSQSQSIVLSTPTSNLSDIDKMDSGGQLENEMADVMDEATTENSIKPKPQIDLKQPASIRGDVEEFPREGESIPPEIEENEILPENKHPTEEIEIEEKPHPKGIDDDKEDQVDSKETDKIDETITQESSLDDYDNNEEITLEDHPEQKTPKEVTVDEIIPVNEKSAPEEKDEGQEDEMKLEKSSKDSVIMDKVHEQEGKLKKTESLEERIGDQGEKYAEDEEGEDGIMEKWDENNERDVKMPPSNIIIEDIRSYDFDPAQDYELRMVSSSKFFHQRDSLRKLYWTEDILYLGNSTCPQLAKALAEIALKQPVDPISYLAHWIYKDYHNRESNEQKLIDKEHAEVAKGSLFTKKDEKLVCPKFGLRRYPIKESTSIISTASHVIQETEELIQ